MGTLTSTLLWLFVVNLGIAFGAGLYEARVAVPRWLEAVPGAGYRWNAEAARRSDSGLRFWIYVTTVPLTLLTLASLVAAWSAPEPVRTWWLAAGAAALADRLMTFAYFIPTMLRLLRDDAAANPGAVETALRWVNLNHVRHAAMLVAWLAALRAFSRMG